MTEKPIIFSGPMVRAILEGRKTQTRRVLKPQPNSGPDGQMVALGGGSWGLSDGELSGEWKLAQPGDLLWVRETYAHGWPMNIGDVMPPQPRDGEVAITYKESGKVPFGGSGKWRSPIHMPRWASRITLRVMDVRVQRLWDISEKDAEAEGANPLFAAGWPSREHIGGFHKIWSIIHGIGTWDENPFVAAISFEKV